MSELAGLGTAALLLRQCLVWVTETEQDNP